MSGPKSVSYVVISQAELDERERRRLSATLAEVVAREQRLAARAVAEREQHGDAVALPARVAAHVSTAGDVRVLSGRVEEAARSVREAEARLQRQVGSAWSARITGALSLGGGSARSASDALANRGATSAPQEKDRRAETRAAVERVVARLSGDAGDEAVSRIEAAAQAALRAGEAQGAEMALGALREEVRRTNETIERDAARVAALEALREELDGLEHPEAVTVRTLIDAAREVGGEADGELARRVGAARKAAEREEDRRFAAATVEQCLDELGYEVGGSFDTLLVNQGFADVRRPEWRGYAVRVRAGGGSSDLRFNVVRGAAGGDTHQRDEEVEEEWCTRLPDLLEQMRTHGLGASVVRRIPAGELPVQVVADLDTAAPAGATAERHRRIEQSLDAP